MALFGRKKTNNEVPEDLQQYYNTGGTGIFKWLLRIVAGLIVLGLLVWGGIWAAHKISNGQTDQPQTAQSDNAKQDQNKAQEQAKAQADAKKAAEEAQKKAQQAAQAQQQAQQPQQPQQVATNNNGSSSSNSGSSQSTQTQPAGGTGGSSSATNDSNLPNTGPGETAAVLFAGATVLGAAAHMVLIRKRQLR